MRFETNFIGTFALGNSHRFNRKHLLKFNHVCLFIAHRLMSDVIFDSWFECDLNGIHLSWSTRSFYSIVYSEVFWSSICRKNWNWLSNNPFYYYKEQRKKGWKSIKKNEKVNKSVKKSLFQHSVAVSVRNLRKQPHQNARNNILYFLFVCIVSENIQWKQLF